MKNYELTIIAGHESPRIIFGSYEDQANVLLDEEGVSLILEVDEQVKVMFSANQEYVLLLDIPDATV